MVLLPSARRTHRHPPSPRHPVVLGWAAAVVIAAAVAALVAAPAALAALSLTTSATPSFTVTINGRDQTPTYALPMTVSDTTGTGAGWNLTITSTPFSTGGATPRSLSDGASSVTAVTSTCAQAPCTDPVNTISPPVPVPAGTTPPAAVKFFDAQTNSGMGQFTVTATITVTIPANTYAGTYTSTLTLNIVSGP